MNRSKILLLCSLFFIAGIGIADITTLPLFGAYFLLIIFIVALFLNKKNLLLRYLIIFSICFLVGTLRCELIKPKITNFDQPEEITLKGIIIKEPESRGNCCELIVKNNLTKEKILLRTDLYPEYFYGDKIEIKCKPKFIEQNTSYGRYLAKNKIEFICYYPKINLQSQNNGNKIYATILNFKQKSRDIIEKTLPDPEAKVLSAIILGYKKQIPNDWREKFAQVGISHIVAISGMHLVIISFILLSVLISLGMWRQKAFYITLILLWLF
ncbi:ComEC family competence protein, partial [bacterium]|nr:ComEC family competence protein [bacterium]